MNCFSLNIENSNKEIRKEFKILPVKLIIRYIFKRTSLEMEIENKVMICSSLLDTDLFFDGNIWSNNEARDISEYLSKSIFLCSRIFIVEKYKSCCDSKKNQIAMSVFAKCKS